MPDPAGRSRDTWSCVPYAVGHIPGAVETRPFALILERRIGARTAACTESFYDMDNTDPARLLSTARSMCRAMDRFEAKPIMEQLAARRGET